MSKIVKFNGKVYIVKMVAESYFRMYGGGNTPLRLEEEVFKSLFEAGRIKELYPHSPSSPRG